MISKNEAPKPEQYDPEIDKIAEQIKESNAKKMVAMKNTIVITSITKKVPDLSKGTVGSCSDLTSIQGQFGWIEIGKEVIPYIMRAGEKYVSDKMVKANVFFQYYMYFTEEIWQYLSVRAYDITAAEAKLLNEINSDHCDYRFGRDKFTVADKIFPLKDALDSYEYITFCYEKLTKPEYISDQRCGFIKIDETSLVPYVLIEDKKLVPLFYFEGDCEYLETHAVNLKGWDLAYLKFVCKIQGIRRPLFDKEVIEAVELEHVKKFFLPGTVFEGCWDVDGKKSDLLKSTEKLNQILSQQAMKSFQSKQQIRKTTAPVSNQKAYHPYRPTYAPNVTVNAHQQRTQQLYYPRPNPGVQDYYTANSAGGTTGLVPGQAAIRPYGSKCYQIPEVNTQNHLQYTLSRNEVDGKLLIGCINMEPFNPTIILVTLEEVAKSLFYVHVKALKNAVNAMSLDIFRPNRQQINTLHNLLLANTEGLIKLTSLVENLPQIKHILGVK